MSYDWKGFNTFILDNTFKGGDTTRTNILYIFANKLYNCTSPTDYNFRLLNAYVNYLHNNAASNTFYAEWAAFIRNMTTITDINQIANMLLVLIDKNTDASGKITPDDMYDDATVGKMTHIDTIKTGDSFINVGANANTVAANIKSTVDKQISTIEGIVLFKWLVFDKLFVALKDADERSYICNYFISDLDAAVEADATVESDTFVIFKKLINENGNVDADNAMNKLNNYITDNKIINNISKNLKFLFEYTDIATSIESKTEDALNCFGSDVEMVLITALNAAPAFTPTITAKPISPFDKLTLPSGWEYYNMVNILSYNIAGLVDPNKVQKIKNVSDLLENVTAGATPYDKFKPDIITLQNANALLGATVGKNKLDTIKTAGKYAIFNHYDDTNASTDVLITLINSDYFKKSGGSMYTEVNFSGFLDIATKKIYYLATVIHKYKVIIINVVDITGTPISFTAIKTYSISNILNKFKNFSIIITGNINHSDTDKDYKKYENSICKYNGIDVKDSYIISDGFKDKSTLLYDFNITVSPLDLTKEYANSLPIGKRMFQDPKKGVRTSSSKSVTAVNLVTLLDDISAELKRLGPAQIDKILASVSAPTIVSPKKKTTSVKAPVATPPPKGKKPIDIQNITVIHFNKVTGFNIDNFKTIPTLTDYNTFNDGGKSFKINIITDKFKFDINSADILQVKTDPTAFCFKVTDTATPPVAYYITGVNITDEFKINIGGTDHVVPFDPSSKKAPGTNIDIAKLKYIDFSTVPGFDYKKITTLPSKYSSISGITANFSVKLTKKFTLKVTNTDIFQHGTKQNFCFKVVDGGTDYFIADVNITDKITIKIGTKVEEVKNFGSK